MASNITTHQRQVSARRIHKVLKECYEKISKDCAKTELIFTESVFLPDRRAVEQSVLESAEDLTDYEQKAQQLIEQYETLQDSLPDVWEGWERFFTQHTNYPNKEEDTVVRKKPARVSREASAALMKVVGASPQQPASVSRPPSVNPTLLATDKTENDGSATSDQVVSTGSEQKPSKDVNSGSTQPQTASTFTLPGITGIFAAPAGSTFSVPLPITNMSDIAPTSKTSVTTSKSGSDTPLVGAFGSAATSKTGTIFQGFLQPPPKMPSGTSTTDEGSKFGEKPDTFGVKTPGLKALGSPQNSNSSLFGKLGSGFGPQPFAFGQATASNQVQGEGETSKSKFMPPPEAAATKIAVHSSSELNHGSNSLFPKPKEKVSTFNFDEPITGPSAAKPVFIGRLVSKQKT